VTEVKHQEYKEYQVLRLFTFDIKLWVFDATVCLMGYSTSGKAPFTMTRLRGQGQ